MRRAVFMVSGSPIIPMGKPSIQNILSVMVEKRDPPSGTTITGRFSNIPFIKRGKEMV
jgi:hypothetical protein